MLSYQQLDLIADTYIPILILTVFFVVRKSGLKSQAAGAIFKSVIAVYALKGLNISFHLWALLGMDYSTHTALAWVFVIFLASQGWLASFFYLFSMLLYAALMVYQEYHTIADIVSTSLVMVPVICLIQRKRPRYTTEKH